MTSPRHSPAQKSFTLPLLLALSLTLASCMSVFTGLETAATPASQSAAAQLTAIRSENGLTPLAPDPTLEKAALAQARNMAVAGRMRHDTGGQRDFLTRMRSEGIRGVYAENIAHGRFDTARVLSIWMDSIDHRTNMLDQRFSRFGLAYAPDPADGDRRYWAMVLAN